MSSAPCVLHVATLLFVAQGVPATLAFIEVHKNPDGGNAAMSHVVHDHRAVTLHRRGLPPQMQISTPQLGAACVVAAAADPGPSPGAVSSSSSSSGALTRHCARVNAGSGLHHASAAAAASTPSSTTGSCGVGGGGGVASSGAASSSSSSSLSREERRRRRRATQKYRTAHATRERIRVEAFNVAFCELRRLLPTLPPDKKLSKIEILKLAICYIAYLNHVLDV
ncbi:twist-related protein 1 [Schistocerca nitens]|uniref:twist-related protein 1 n=1 Tax=Schistocerca nitens TaxID=7011 RepID=UPI0021187E74|nr:twist-related protein 1 [Schistocerca nitens]